MERKSPNIQISVENNDVAKYENGEITAVGAGETIINLKSESGLTASCTIKVEKVKNIITAPFDKAVIIIGQELEYAATVEIVDNSDSSDTTVDYISSDETVIKYENGKIKGLKVGNAVITATSKDGVSVICEIKVINETKGNSDLPYVIDEKAGATVTKTTDGLYYSAFLDEKKDSGKMYIDLPLSMNKIVSFDFAFIINGGWIGDKTYFNFIVNDLYDADLKGANIDKVDVNTSASIGLKGFQTRFVSDIGWEAWNCIQYAVMNDNGYITGFEPYSANLNDNKINEVVKDLRHDKKVNVKIENTGDNFNLTITAYNENGTLTENVWILSIPVNTVNFEHEPYLGIMVNNYDAKSRNIGFVISNFLNGNVESLKINESGETVGLKIGENNALTVEQKLKPNAVSGFDTTIVWSSSDEEIVTIGENGKLIGLKPGNAVIKATDTEGNEATCNVAIDVDSLVVNSEKTINAIYGTEGAVIDAVVIPATVKITFESSDTNVVTVSEDGTLTYTGVGRATITVYSGLKKVEVAVNVSVESVTLNFQTLNLDKFESFTLIADCGGAPHAEWSSSNSAIVKVDNNGKVTALDYGTATITVTLGDKKATCVINVVNTTSSSDEESSKKTSKCNDISLTGATLLFAMVASAAVLTLKKKGE